jgi:hypothetical protein
MKSYLIMAKREGTADPFLYGMGNRVDTVEAVDFYRDHPKCEWAAGYEFSGDDLTTVAHFERTPVQNLEASAQQLVDRSYLLMLAAEGGR